MGIWNQQRVHINDPKPPEHTSNCTYPSFSR
eukprot:CAMPEP_0172752900 /NCGR_PEP_ID=MMETSP1074-20121228/154784_1 /TAXON_ID=2916 /ORGANISM="Ceratium fusus, Strain PA161109" /LENGTH=30 /DNA_ID= /DNA_START= /DNA_END= /DNA_ORIENTATION=